MEQFNALIEGRKYRAVYAKEWMFEFCKENGIPKGGPFLINFFIYFIEKNYLSYKDRGEEPTDENNHYFMDITDEGLCEAILGEVSKAWMQKTLRPALVKAGVIEVVESGRGGLKLKVNLDVLQAFLYRRINTSNIDVLIRRYRRINTSNTIIYIKDKEEKGDSLDFQAKKEEERDGDVEAGLLVNDLHEEVKEEVLKEDKPSEEVSGGVTPDEMAVMIEDVIRKNKKLEKARRKLIGDSKYNIDDFKSTFSHWLTVEYTDFELVEDGRGLEALMKIHLEYLDSYGQSKSSISVDKSFGKDKADKVVEFMMENCADMKFDKFEGRYMYNPDGSEIKADKFFKEKEIIILGLRKKIISENDLKLYMAYAKIIGRWPTLEIGWFFRDYDLEDYAGILSYREMMKKLRSSVDSLHALGKATKQLYEISKLT